MPTRSDYDLVIAGGGPIGLTLACALADRGLHLAILDANPAAARTATDDRSYALAYASRCLLAALGLWDTLAATPIHQIHVSEQGRAGIVRLHQRDYQVPALGYVVAAADLQAVLRKRLRQQPGIDWLQPALLASLTLQPEAVQIGARYGETPLALSGRLLVAADGAHSRIREQLGIPTLHRSYEQAAIIAELRMELAHHNTAYERFTPDGPLALLPLADPNLCTLVYTVAADALDASLALTDDAFAAAVEQRFGERLGRVLAVGPRRGYPLSLIKARAHYRPRVVLIGNAAHSLHPIAGQGLNLGLRDVAVLAELIATAQRDGTDIGGAGLLARYGHWRDGDQRRTLAFTDGLARLFTSARPPLILARGLGLGLLELVPPAKRLLANQSMGLLGRLPRLLRGLPLPEANS